MWCARIEWAASAMEMSVLSASNVANLVVKEWRGQEEGGWKGEREGLGRGREEL